MTDDRRKSPRTLLVADHLWEAFSMMAVEMGSDREALVNQALFTFARLNGFLVPSDVKRLGQQLPLTQVAAVSQPVESSRPRPLPGPPTLVPNSEPASLPFFLPKSKASGASPVEVEDSLLADEHHAATSLELPNLAAAPGAISEAAKDEARPSTLVASARSAEPSATPALVLSAEGRDPDRVVKERFLIGRGKHCDLIINSGKVSREHAVITREGPAYFIEDLGSSNGTWFEKRRIGKRQIEDGDEYFICSEKLTCAFR
jgi:hypothetical protein